jgi:hypothetical protein
MRTGFSGLLTSISPERVARGEFNGGTPAVV